MNSDREQMIERARDHLGELAFHRLTGPWGGTAREAKEQLTRLEEVHPSQQHLIDDFIDQCLSAGRSSSLVESDIECVGRAMKELFDPCDGTSLPDESVPTVVAEDPDIKALRDSKAAVRQGWRNQITLGERPSGYFDHS